MGIKIKLSVFFVFAMLSVNACDNAEPSPMEDVVGQSCTIDSFLTKCIGNDVLYCDRDGTTKLSQCDTKICVEMSVTEPDVDCEEDDEECQLSHISSAVCMDKSEQCSKEGDVRARCEKLLSGATYSREYKCEMTNNGRLVYRRTKSVPCYDGYGVCSENGECLNPQTCDLDELRCDGNMLVICDDNRLKTSDCSAYSPARTCMLVDESPKCVNENDICTQEGKEIITSCSPKNNKEYVKICSRASDGNLYYVTGASRTCSDGCNEDNSACAEPACTVIDSEIQKCLMDENSISYVVTYICKPCPAANGMNILKRIATEECDGGFGICSDNGECIPAEECDAESYISRCDGNTALTCVNNKVRHSYCDRYDSPAICAVVANKAQCFEETDVCHVEGKMIATSCDESTKQISISKCTASADGKYYYVSSGFRNCPNGCNEKGTNCAD